MELNASTFVFEIINFLILIWILQRFLYRPVLDVIARRRQNIEQTLSDAKSLRAEAQTLQHQYQGRLADWEQEKQTARDALQQEIEAERTRRLDELKTALRQERDKAQVVGQRQLADTQHRNEAAALAQAARFAARLLAGVASPELEAKLIDLTLAMISDWPDEQLTRLRSAYDETQGPIKITSAYTLDTAQRERVQNTFKSLLSADIVCQFEQNPALLAGLHIDIGPWVLRANLQDELKSFAESDNNSSDNKSSGNESKT